jgi:hypothetical protein
MLFHAFPFPFPKFQRTLKGFFLVGFAPTLLVPLERVNQGDTFNIEWIHGFPS